MLIYFFRLILLFAAVIGLFLLVGAMLPRSFDLTETIEIDAPVEAVYAQVADLESWLQWSPWVSQATEPTVQVSEASDGRSALSWEDPRGAGKLWINDKQPPNSINYQLAVAQFKEVYGSFEFAGDRPTQVTWRFRGRLPGGPFYGYFQFFFPAEMRRQMQTSLQRLQQSLTSESD